jgi:hypothetical protein
MKLNEFIDNTDIVSIIMSTFYYYDNKWNFPYGDDIGYSIIEHKSNMKLDSIIKEKIPKMEKYLNDNNIKYEDIDVIFNDIWKKV